MDMHYGKMPPADETGPVDWYNAGRELRQQNQPDTSSDFSVIERGPYEVLEDTDIEKGTHFQVPYTIEGPFDHNPDETPATAEQLAQLDRYRAEARMIERTEQAAMARALFLEGALHRMGAQAYPDAYIGRMKSDASLAKTTALLIKAAEVVYQTAYDSIGNEQEKKAQQDASIPRD
jgi:hypothetical protein